MRRGDLLFFICCLWGSVVPATVFAAEDYSLWSYSQKIFLNTSATGANVPDTVLNFPVLIRLNPGNFKYFLQTSMGGADMRFAKNDGTHLAYQIERWIDNAGNDTAEIWVKVDTVYGNNSSQSIVMYYGKSGAVDSSKGSAVFDTAKGFQAVWHLGDSTTSVAAVDATVNNYNASRSGNVARIPGGVGYGQTFDGTGDYFTAANVSKVGFGTVFTASCWLFIPSGDTNPGAVWSLSDGDATWEPEETQFFLGDTGTGPTQQGLYPKFVGYNRNWINSANQLATNGWHYVSCVYRQSDNTRQIYIDGTPATLLLSNYGGGTDPATTFIIGKRVSFDVNNDFNGRMDELRIENVVRSPGWIKLCYQNQKAAPSLISLGALTLAWDTSATTGTQAGSGSWGSSSYWSTNGTQLAAWPGAGATAQFTGSAGTYAITVAGTQRLDSLIFQTSGYTISGDTLDFGTKSGIFVADAAAATVGSVINGSGGLTKYGRGTLGLTGANTYTGPTRITGGRLSASLLPNGGTAGSIGVATSAAANLTIDSASLVYTGAAQSCDRLFTLGARGNDSLIANGTGALLLANTGATAFSGSGTRRLVLGGSNTGNNTLSAVIGDGTGGATSIIKSGAGTWVLTGVSTYTGTTSIGSGTLFVNGSLAASSAVTVAAGATISGSGIIAGSVNAAGATILPGNAGPGKLRTGTLTLDSTSKINFDIGSTSDTIAVTGNLTLNGMVNINPVAGFAPGTYLLFTCTGTLKNDTLTVGTVPAGRRCTFEYGAGYVNAVFTARLLQSEPVDTVAVAGRNAVFTASAIGAGTLSYAWQRSPDSAVGTGTTLTVGAVTTAMSGARYRCIVSDSFASDTSRWAILTVVDTPRVTVQPRDSSIRVGAGASFSFTLADTTRCTYSWLKAGAATVRSTGRTLAFTPAALTDDGDYYCLITNPAGTVRTDTVRLTVRELPPVARCTYVPQSGFVPLEVSFIDSSSGTITSRRWEFGDGASDTAARPKHTFTSAGRFGVRLIVVGPGGIDTTDTAYVTVNHPSPVARFSFSPATGLAPLAVAFFDSSTGPITSRKWYFGDGGSDTVRNPKHTYAKTGLFTVALAVTGPGGRDSVAKKDSILVFEKGQNPLRLHANHLAGNKVVFTIDNINMLDTALPAPRCDSVGIWFMTGAIPLKRENSKLVAVYPRSSLKRASITDTIQLSLTDSIAGFMTGLFWDNGTVSEFLSANGCILKVGSNRDTSVTARITKLAFDSITASLQVSWCFDTANFPGEVDVGICYSLDSVPLVMNGTRIVTAFSECTTSTVMLDEPLRFDTLYHVALFVKVSEGKWSGFDTSSYDTVRTGHPFRQVISFVDNKTRPDTLTAFNDKIIISKDKSDTISLRTDTLEVYPYTPPPGFTVVASSIRFVKAGTVLPLTIGMRIGSLHDSLSLADVRIYRDSAGLLLACYGTVLDSSSRVVSIRTDDLRQPFIAMIDRSRPKVTFLTKSDTIAYAGKDLVDSIKISDNIANVRWSFLYGKGEDAIIPRDSAELRDTVTSRRFVISKDSRAISSESGLRAWIIISDAAHCDTVDLSRPVFRDSSDKATTTDNMWCPLYATARLASVEPDSSLIPYVNKHSASYDRRYVRLFRWIETEVNKQNDTGKWVEYEEGDAKIRSLFALEPGRLFWIKTRGNIPFDLGDARTVSLKDTFSISLPAHQYTDIGVPYRFGIRIKDILQASGGRVDSVRFFKWILDSASNRYALDPFYVTTMPDKKDPMQQLEYGIHRGYCLYNPSADARTLRIPPVSAAMSAAGSSLKKSADKGWCAKLITTCNGEGRLPQIYMGYAPNLAKSEFPPTPSFGMVRISVFDRSSGKHSAHYIADDAGAGIVNELRITNASDSSQQIDFNFQTVGSFPENYTALLFEASTGRFFSEGTITVAPHSTVSRWCSIGDAGWHTKFGTAAVRFAYGLRRIYPNPARSIVNIGFTIPFDAQEQLQFSVFDLRGRRIWDKRFSGLQLPGLHVVSWNGRDNRQNRVGAGMYLIRLSVIGSSGKALRQFEQPVTYLP